MISAFKKCLINQVIYGDFCLIEEYFIKIGTDRRIFNTIFIKLSRILEFIFTDTEWYSDQIKLTASYRRSILEPLLDKEFSNFEHFLLNLIK